MWYRALYGPRGEIVYDSISIYRLSYVVTITTTNTVVVILLSYIIVATESVNQNLFCFHYWYRYFSVVNMKLSLLTCGHVVLF